MNTKQINTRPTGKLEFPSNLRRSWFALLGGLIGFFACSPLVFSQVVSDEEDIETLDAMVSVGFGSSLAASIEEKREANQVIDTINSEEIGQFPDQNVSEAIQRITGVNITRTNGEGEKVAVRGLAPNFTRVEVDGRSSMVTADDAEPERDGQMSVFSSDLISSIEVIKSPTAADVEGGVGGIVRMKTRDPLDLGGLTWALNGTYTWSKYKDQDQYKVNGLYGNTFNDGTMGILIGVTHEERDRRVDKIESNQNFLEVNSGFLEDDTDPAQTALIGSFYPGRTRYALRSGDNPRTNVNANFQWLINPDLEFFAKSYFTSETRNEERTRIQMQWSRGDLNSGTRNANDTLDSAEIDRHRVDIQSRSRDADITSNNIGGGLEWDNGTWTVRGEYGFSDGKEDFVESDARHRANRDGLAMYDMRPDFKRPEMDTPSINEAREDLDLDRLRQQKRIISYKENVFTIDAGRETDWGWISSIAAGLRWNDTGFKRRQGDEGRSTDKPNGDPITFADGDPVWGFGGGEPFGFGQGPAGMPTSWPAVNPFSLFEQFPLGVELTFNNSRFYNVDEETLAGYLMANFDNESDNVSIRGNLGVRVVNTKVNGTGRTSILYEESPGVPVTDTVDDFSSPLNTDYTEPLPAFNLVVAPNNSNFLFRGAITRALSRPTVAEMSPAASIDTIDQEIESGNPGLEPFKAWQYDLGFEYYFGDARDGLFSVNGFHKDVDNFITESSFMETFEFPEYGVPSQEYFVETFVNGGTATITGVEVTVQSTFTFLPGFLSYMGGMANYTYIDSEFTDPNGTKLPFPGTSENTYNLILFYDQGGFSGRLAYNFRDDFLDQPSGSATNNVFTEGAGRLDLGLRYRFENGFKVTFDAINLTEEQQYKYYDIPERMEDLTFEGRIFTVGVGYTF